MSETTTTTDGDVDETTRQSDRVPYARYEAANRKLADEKKRAAELEDRLEALEAKDKSDVERLTKELEKVTKRAAEAEGRATELEQARERDGKAALVSAAAQNLKFHNPALAAKILDLDDIEDAKTAEAAVKALVKEQPYLVQNDPPERQRLKQVGVDGTVIDEKARERDGLVTEEEQRQMWGEELKKHLDAASQMGASGTA